MKFVYSPNFDSNRKKIDTIFIHWIVGNLASADAVFKKTDPGTSAHYAVEDSEIHQYVVEENVAYHAGVYTWNQRSIGIEHSASPDRPASDKTYETSGKLISEIAKRWNIPLDREHVKGHKEVKSTQCPGTMDIDRLIAIAKSQTEQMASITQVELDQIRSDRDANYVKFRTLCEALNVTTSVDVALAEINKFVGLEDTLMDKERQINEASTKIADLEVQLNELSATSTNLKDANAILNQQIMDQKEVIHKQDTSIIDMSDQLTELKKLIKMPVFSGWKKQLVLFLSKI